MDKEGIEQLIQDGLDPGTDGGWWNQKVSRLAEAIAAQHNLELARARSEKTALLPCGHPAANADDDGCAMCRLVAQVAVMTEALENLVRIRKHVPGESAMRDNQTSGGLASISRSLHYSIDDVDEAWQKVDNALCAAPKVWWMRGRTSKYYDLEAVADDAPDEFRQLLIARGMFAPWDVYACLPKAEQPTESEQEATDGTH